MSELKKSVERTNTCTNGKTSGHVNNEEVRKNIGIMGNYNIYKEN